MKKIKFLNLFLIILLLVGCQTSQPKGQNFEDTTLVGIEEVTKDQLIVYTSFYPMYDFAKKVGGDHIQLYNMMPVGTDPHDWEPTPRAIAQLEKADVFIYHGVGFEHWVDKVLNTIKNPDLLVVEASQGVDLITGEGHAHDHSHEHNHDEDTKIIWDSHVWLSINRAQQEMENIKNALVKVDPANAAIYETNYQNFSGDFKDLDRVFRKTLDPLSNKSIVVAHQAFGYLCADYGLTQEAIEGLSADSEPDPERMAEIVKFAREHQINTIFFEELVSPKVAQTIATELGVNTAILNPLEGLTQEQMDAGEDYISIMKQNLNALEKALK